MTPSISLNKKANKILKVYFPEIAKLSGAFAGGIIGSNILDTLSKFKSKADHDKPEELPYEEPNLELLEENTSYHLEVVNLESGMNFEAAFRFARSIASSNGIFEYNGEWYSTLTKEELASLSDSQKAAYAEAVNETIEQGEAKEVLLEEATKEDLGDLLVTATEPVAASEHQYDLNGDGELDGALVNLDGDEDAEVVYDWGSGELVAFVDTENDGMIDALYNVLEDGKLEFVAELEDPIPAPKMPVTQLRDLNHNDGIIDSKLYDTDGDMIADRVDVDLTGDGKFSKAYIDTNGDGSLDTVADIIDGQLANIAELNTPLHAPELLAIAEGMNKPQIKEQAYEETNELLTANEDTIEGMDNEADMSDWSEEVI
ncbi:MAG: hypothetical protein AAF849_21190 [Bacteroidota bacterium]